jgi:hypothetical protein
MHLSVVYRRRTHSADQSASKGRTPATDATAESGRPNERWALDFVSERLCDRRWFRVLTVVDQFTREMPITAGRQFAYREQKVALALSQVIAEREAPESITVDNELSSQAWRWTRGLISTGCSSISSGQDDRWKMAISNRLTAAARRVSECACILHRRRRARKSFSYGAKTTIRCGRTAH